MEGFSHAKSQALQPRVCVVNPGTIRVFRVAHELKKRNLLARCVTSVYFPELIARRIASRGTFGRLGKIVSNKIANRRCAELDGLVVQWPWPELLHLCFSRLGVGNANAWIRWRNRLFGKWATSHALNGVDIIWGFDTSSLEIFEAAKRIGIQCILDVSTAHPLEGEKILKLQTYTRPEYFLHAERCKKKAEIDRRQEEMALADFVVVASIFTKRTLEHFGLPPRKILMNPLGVDLAEFTPDLSPKTSSSIVFLFVGWFSQPKGIYHLLEAWKESNLSVGFELWLVGGFRCQLKDWPGRFPNGVRILGQIPHASLPEIYKKAHVFVFPSLFEGFAKVILEAMASGLPVITTYNSAGPDLIDPGVHGYIINPGDIAELARLMSQMAREPQSIKKMGEAARARAEHFTWTAYGDRCASICRALYRNRGAL